MSYAKAIGLVRQALPRIAKKRDIPHLKLRIQLLVAAAHHARYVATIYDKSSPSLHRIAQERPETIIGALLWPYLCAGWDAQERLERIRTHYRIIDKLGPPFPFAADERLVLATRDDIYCGLRIVLDQPHWFMREGGLTLSLFVKNFRAYSLAFSFDKTQEGVDCLIGSIQGRSSNDVTALYRDLTKAAFGLRPRDLLIEICRMLCRHWKIRRVLAVRDSERHHRHPFFRGKTVTQQNYDAIWEDRGGTPEGRYFYRLPIESERRADARIKPNKRSLYRRRYKFLDALEQEIATNLPHLRPQQFEDL